MNLEIERKWLIKKLPELSAHAGEEISQGYLNLENDSAEVRLRSHRNRYFQTVKLGNSGLSREEFEIELTDEQFLALWPATAGRRIEKTRYRINSHGYIIELDVYHGSLEGLVVAEVEFQSEEHARAFVPPHWFGREVTEDSRYKNRNLAQFGKITKDASK